MVYSLWVYLKDDCIPGNPDSDFEDEVLEPGVQRTELTVEKCLQNFVYIYNNPAKFKVIKELNSPPLYMRESDKLNEILDQLKPGLNGATIYEQMYRRLLFMHIDDKTYGEEIAEKDYYYNDDPRFAWDKRFFDCLLRGAPVDRQVRNYLTPPPPLVILGEDSDDEAEMQIAALTSKVTIRCSKCGKIKP